MGFSYTFFGLCCDFCGHSEPEYNVKKIDCPYGWCQAWACCKNCKAKKLHLKSSCTIQNKNHKEICKPLHIEFIKKQEEKQTLINNGYFVRVAASCNEDKVKVIFKGKNSEKTLFMSHKTYDSIPLGDNATIEDYRVIGELTT